MSEKFKGGASSQERSSYWTAEHLRARKDMEAAILAGDRDALDEALVKLPGMEHLVHHGNESIDAMGPRVIDGAKELGLDPSISLPEGSKLMTYSAKATGHGSLRMGDREIDDKIDVGGLVPDELDSNWTENNGYIFIFGAKKSLKSPDGNGGYIGLDVPRQDF